MRICTGLDNLHTYIFFMVVTHACIEQIVRTTPGGSGEEISFRVKCILAFQRVAGADLIIFGM